MKRSSVLTALAVLVGCGGSASLPSDGEIPPSMFEPPPAGSRATPDSLFGLWGGGGALGSTKYDLRLRVTADRTTVATRCSFGDGTVLTASVSAMSRVSTDREGSCPSVDRPSTKCGEITMLESKSDRSGAGQKWCSVDLKPTAYQYALTGLRLHFGTGAERIELVKISD